MTEPTVVSYDLPNRVGVAMETLAALLRHQRMTGELTNDERKTCKFAHHVLQMYLMGEMDYGDTEGRAKSSLDEAYAQLLLASQG